MNEAETRAELIDPALTRSGWGVVEDSKVFREFNITAGKIQRGSEKSQGLKADYVLSYKGIKLAVIEAKSDEQEVGEGVGQAKLYAKKLALNFTYATNGKEIYEINLQTGKEALVNSFPSPIELWNRAFPQVQEPQAELVEAWRDEFFSIPFEDFGGTKRARYYQEVAVNKTMIAIAKEQKRILLTLATGTGKTFIAFQIAWKLFQSRWNLRRDGERRPRILFLADRNILADQAYNAFSAFSEDALLRIRPDDIKKKGKVPTNGSIFFTIFQTFMSGTDKDGKPAPYFGDYPKDFFDLVIIDECHRGGANDESNWRSILDYFSPAVQIGLTATPKRKDNADTYRYFGEPVYIYSLKEGINDGFLTPFKVKRVQTTIDTYIYVPDDTIIEGDIEEGREYVEHDFNRIIEIKEREKKRVEIFLDEIDQNQKTIVFCANQAHAAAIRDLINQNKTNTNSDYCVRVTANDGLLGEQYLRDFQDNEKTIPTILTTSQKLSTGVDARNIRNIVLLRTINSMIEFKQIIGRGTRLFDGKEYFTIYDFVAAYHHFADPEWDGEPIAPEPIVPSIYPTDEDDEPLIITDGDDDGGSDKSKAPKIKIKLRDGKEREIQHMISTSFWSADGKPISAEEFLHNLFGLLPSFFENEDELRTLWSDPKTRKALLEKLSEAGIGKDALRNLQELINAEKSDLYDVLEYVAFAKRPITREERVEYSKKEIVSELSEIQKEFIEFVLAKYIESGVEELDQDKLPKLLELKYHTLSDASELFGGVENIQKTFLTFQKYLYAKIVA